MASDIQVPGQYLKPVLATRLVGALFHIVLYRPLIPQNTGSIARLAAGTGAVLHLIHPLGFSVSEKAVRRAGLDYWASVDVREHESWEGFLQREAPEDLFFFSKFGTTPYTSAQFPRNSFLIFGNETGGLPQELRSQYPDRVLHIPIRRDHVRSLNLAQCTSIVLYEALRQNQFPI